MASLSLANAASSPFSSSDGDAGNAGLHRVLGEGCNCCDGRGSMGNIPWFEIERVLCNARAVPLCADFWPILSVRGGGHSSGGRGHAQLASLTSFSLVWIRRKESSACRSQTPFGTRLGPVVIGRRILRSGTAASAA
jgi:hypothetical protein